MKIKAAEPANSSEALLRRMAARRRRDNIVVGVLAVLAVLGGGNALIDFFSADRPKPTDATAVSVLAHAQLAGSFAEQFVVAYLSATNGQQERIGEFVGTAQHVSLPMTARQVSDPMVVYVSRAVADQNIDVWSVTVAVRVGKPGGTSANEVRQFYRVAVSLAGGRPRALSLPALVPAPSRGIDLALAYAGTCGPESPLAQVASGFLGALLTGTGDVSRYIASGAGITALQPTPFNGIEAVTVLSDSKDCGVSGETARVLATITPKGETGALPALAYPLTLARNGGQWQVRAMEPVPALANPLAELGKAEPRGNTSSSGTTTPSPTVQVPPATQK
ncbi:conjugal transfer protein [Nocardia brasiliensis]|uniref:conjugal transfer protein n=1 Tax=Nocardia brasiliensis TaxID=37326 RepID=UPI002456334E|nr:conjugal transfer protein [Nocardia brasiliensis]